MARPGALEGCDARAQPRSDEARFACAGPPQPSLSNKIVRIYVALICRTRPSGRFRRGEDGDMNHPMASHCDGEFRKQRFRIILLLPEA